MMLRYTLFEAAPGILLAELAGARYAARCRQPKGDENKNVAAFRTEVRYG